MAAGLASGPARATSLTTIYSFTGGADGSDPTTGLVVGPGGALYGANRSVVYELTQGSNLQWTVTPIYAGRVTSLVGATDALYGIDSQAVVALTPPTNGATLWTSTTLHTFIGGKDGDGPAGIAIAPDGSIGGTTFSGGGATDACGSDNGKPTGCGTLFTLKKKADGVWKETILHKFKGGNDGAFPDAAPSFDPKGNIYFSTEQGGGTTATAAARGPRALGRAPREEGSCGGDGTIGFFTFFYAEYRNDIWRETCEKVGPAFANSVLFDIGVSISKTPHPQAPTVAAETPAAPKAAKALIATWTGGGITSDCPELENNGCGVVGILERPADGSTPWKLEVLHNFTDSDGALPSGYMTADGADTIYGVTVTNGSCANGYGFGGCGTIYKLQDTANGWAWGGVVYRFAGGASGTIPVPQLLLYKGTLFGATTYGGVGCGNVGCGTLFSLTP